MSWWQIALLVVGIGVATVVVLAIGVVVWVVVDDARTRA
jgi:hypothetical protein